MEQEKSVRTERDLAPGVARGGVVRKLLKRAKKQDGMLLVIEGNAGMGKTFMLRHLVDAAPQLTNWDSTFVRTDEIERNEPYSFIERFVASGVSPDWFFTPDAETDPVSLARECVSRLVESAGESGHVIVVDDAQWIDAESERVLRYVIPRVIRRRILFAFGVRAPHLPGSFGEFLMNLASDDPRDKTISLTPLTAREVAAMVLDRFGAGISARSAQRVLDGTDGSYLAVDSVFSSLSEREIAQLHLSWDTVIRVDMQSKNPLLHRFKTLSPDAQATCEIVCLAGHELTRERLREVARTLGDTLALDEALSSEVLVESVHDSVIMPRHQLLGEAIKETVPSERAKQVFRILADSTSGHRSMLHMIRGAEAWSEDLHAAVDEYVGKEVDAGHFGNASEVLREALNLAAGHPARTTLLEDLVLTHMEAKSSYLVLDLLDEVDALPKTILNEVMSIILSAHVVGQEAPAERVQRVLATPPRSAEDIVALAHIAFMMVILTMRTSDYSMMLQLIGAARMLTEQAPADPHAVEKTRARWMVDQPGQLLILDTYAVVHAQMSGDAGTVKQQLPDLIRRAEALPVSSNKVDVLVAIAGAELSVGHLESGRKHAETAVDLLGQVNLPWAAATARVILADCMVMQGEYEAALDFIDLTEEFAYTTMDIEMRPVLSVLRVMVAAIIGDHDAQSYKPQARKQREFTWEGHGPDLALLADCEAARVNGDPREVLAISGDEWASRIRNSRHGVLTYRAHALIDLGRLDEAAELIDQLAEWRGIRWLEYWGTLDWLKARLAEATGDHSTALWHYEAAALNRHFPLPRALTLSDHGNLLQTLGRSEEAATVLAEAVSVLEEIGAHGYLPRVRERLSTARGTEAAEASEILLTTLTERERQIAKQVASGRSNNQIAESLVLSISTVRSHVSNVLRKLRLSSRGEVVKLLREVTE